MNIPEIAVKRPVGVTMVVMIFILLGGIAMFNLNVDLYPNIDYPNAFIRVPYPGVAPADMENIVTRKIEEELNSLENVKNINSHSQEGQSMISVEFVWGTNLDLAAVDLREKVDSAKRKLPSEIERIMVGKQDMNARPIMDIALGGEYDARTLRTIADKEIIPILQRISGVAAVDVSGGLEREIRVKVDPTMLNSLGITINDVIKAMNVDNQDTPVGDVTEGNFKYLVRAQGEIKKPEELGKVIVKKLAGRPVYLNELATIEDSYKDRSSISRMNGTPSVTLGVRKTQGANPVLISDAVQKLIPEIARKYQGKLQIVIGNDNSTFIKESITMATEAAIIGGILSIFIIFAFLRNLRATFIIGTSIPLAIIVTFLFMYMKKGMTINLITLGGLALGIGIMVDNAIVSLENIFRYVRLHGSENREQCAIKATNEVMMVILASTLTHIVVFVPIGLVPGATGEMFFNLALTIIFAEIATYFVAISFVPMLASKMLKVETEKKEPLMDVLRRAYKRNLFWLLSSPGRRWGYIAAVAVVFCLSLAFLPAMEFFPYMDRGMFSIRFSLPEGTTVEKTDETVRQIESILKKYKDAERIITRTEMGGGNLTVILPPRNVRTLSVKQLMTKVREEVGIISGVIRITYTELKLGQGYSHGTGKPIQIEVAGDDFPVIEDLCRKVAKQLKNVSGLRDIDDGTENGRPEVRIEFDKEKLRDLQLDLATVSGMVRTYVYGSLVGKFKEANEEFDIRVEAADVYKDQISKLRELKIVVDDKTTVILSQVARIYFGSSYTTINRRNLKRIQVVEADIKDRPLQAVTLDIQKELAKVQFPDGYIYNFGGEEEERKEAFRNLLMAMIAAFLLVYIVMAIQYDSFIDPFVIMFTIPLSIIGVVAALKVFGMALSTTAFIGVIMLGGIVVNNGIILVDFINHRRVNEKEDKITAVLESGAIRLRPILMTVLTTILGMIPLSLGIGSGADFFQPLAVTVIGGLTISTLFTLTFIPVLYVIMDNTRESMMRWVKIKF
ncbi:MAG: efflux RND transporter permease subunit [Candidatus Wallbacteria bacterium]|nr:efflux RND transporter permease subunit [Candidatus Wallbacteria bacterium]